ncbi:MAG: helix-turn-helix transcriptional regulator [Ruthenibacterium sp.]
MTRVDSLNFLKQIAKGIAQQFGTDCEVVVHALTNGSLENSIVAIENGHVTNRKVGDGPSHVVLEAMQKNADLKDRLGYLTKTKDGKILKSSTLFIKDEDGHPICVLSINYDITGLQLAGDSINHFIAMAPAPVSTEPERIFQSVGELLDELIEQAVTLVGKPVALMTKADKIKAIQFLNNAGAFLITKSGDKVSRFFGISKYTLYSYIDAST